MPTHGVQAKAPLLGEAWTQSLGNRMRNQIWFAEEKGEIISLEEAHTRVAARMRRHGSKTADEGVRQTTSSGR
jgi:hypothetical protein